MYTYPTTPDPSTAPALSWGVLGPGGIAHNFVRSAQADTAARIVAVGSRDLGRAQTFAGEYGIPAAYGSYEELVADPAVEAVYVASPHSHHHEHALLAIRAGKHVLVEKAFTLTEAQAVEVFDAAREAGVFAMEAMWSRFLPHMVALRGLLADGVIGEVKTLYAAHLQTLLGVPRLVRPELGGGAMLDLGVYPVAFAHDVLGNPDAVRASGTLLDTGVDETVAMTLEYASGARAQLMTSLDVRSGANIAEIGGTQGSISIPAWFYTPQDLHIRVGDEHTVLEIPAKSGFSYQIAEVARRVAAGETQSPVRDWQGTLETMHTMDSARHQVGARFDFEA